MPQDPIRTQLHTIRQQLPVPPPDHTDELIAKVQAEATLALCERIESLIVTLSDIDRALRD